MAAGGADLLEIEQALARNMRLISGKVLMERGAPPAAAPRYVGRLR